jgi:RHS repeat-associated protein
MVRVFCRSFERAAVVLGAVALGATSIVADVGVAPASAAVSDLDGTFDGDGIVGPIASGRYVVAAPYGRVVVGGLASATDLVFRRYLSSGALDAAYGTAGVASFPLPELSGFAAGGVAARSDGTTIAAFYRGIGSPASSTEVKLVSVTGTGQLDASFGVGGVATLSLGSCVRFMGEFTLDSAGRPLFAAENFDNASCPVIVKSNGLRVVNGRVMRLTTTGALDLAFAGDGSWDVPNSTGSSHRVDEIVAGANGEFYVLRVLKGWELSPALPYDTTSTYKVPASGFNELFGGWQYPTSAGATEMLYRPASGTTPAGVITVINRGVYFRNAADMNPDATRPAFLTDGDHFVMTAGGAFYVGGFFQGKGYAVRRVNERGTFDDWYSQDGYAQAVVGAGTYPIDALTADTLGRSIALSGIYNAPLQLFRFRGAAPRAMEVVAADTTGGSGVPGALVEDPVNTASGNLTDTQVDLAGEAFGLDVTRAYNTFDPATSTLGKGWRVGTGPSIAQVGSDYRLTLADGTPFTFTADGGGGWTSPDRANASLSVDSAPPVAGGTLPMLRLTHDDGTVDRFDTLGRLIEQRAWDGRNAVSVYDASGTLSTVTASTGQVLTFGYDGSGRLTSASLSTGRSVSYGYNSAGLLSSVIDEFGATTTMTYNSQGWLATNTDPSGVVKMSNVYDSLGRVVTQTSASGGTTTFTYNTDGTTLVHDSVTNTSVRYVHDVEGRVIAISDPFGGIAERSFDDRSNQTSGVDRNGQTATATYDARDNLLSTTQAGVGTTSYTYDNLDRLLTVTDPWGAVTTYAYELDERIPSAVTNALNQVTTYDVVNGLVMSVTDADGVTATYTYDAQRRPLTVSNEYGQTTSYEYNARGQRTKRTSPSGRVTTWTYDATSSRLVSSTAPDGGITSYTYDAAGRTLTVTDPTGAVTTNAYDTAGRVSTVTDPGGAVTSYQYDGNDQLLKTIEPGGGERTTTYGPLGRVTSTKDALNRSTSYVYDAEGRQIKSTDPAGGVRQTVYDAQGRPFKTIDPKNRETVTAYDAQGRVLSVTAPGGLVTSYGYDVLGRVTTVTDQRGGVTSTAFTLGGRTNTITDPAGLVTSFGYDLAGRQVSVTRAGNLTTTVAYNADGEVVSSTSPSGLVSSVTFDPSGRVATSTNPAGIVTTNTWSLRGELLTTKTGAQGTVSFTYHPNGTMATATDALGRVTTFGHDARRNQTSRTAANGAVDNWTYNASNELTTAVDPLGRSTSYTYDAAGRPATVTDPSGRVLTTTYHLDGTINTEAYTGGTTTTYGYDTVGRVTSLADSSGTHSFTYEPGGQLTSMTTPTGRQTKWGYDAAGRRITITFPDGARYGYSYDNAGRPHKITPAEVMADTFTATTNGAADSAKWTTATASGGTATIQTNALRLLWANTASSTASITSKAVAEQDSEQLVRFQFAATSSTTVGKFVVKARNSTAGHIRVELTSNSTTARVFKQIGTTSTQLGTFTTTVATTAKWVRVRVVGSTIDVRLWADGTTEPTTWNSTLTNATGVTTAGVPRVEVTRTSGTNSVTIDNYTHTNPSVTTAPVVTYNYNTDNQVTSETLVGGSRARAYTLGRLTNFTETLPGLSLTTGRTYDTSGRIATETTAGVTTTYGYDQAGQLTAATPTTGTATSWTYDQIGQRATETIGATTSKYHYDIAGQICWTTTAAMPATPACDAPPSGATTYTHDTAGRMLTETITATNKVTYTYDPAGRQTSSSRVNGATTTTQTRTYNPLHQLVGLTNTGGSTTTSTLDWDSTSVAAQLTGITTNGSTTDLVGGPTGWTTARIGATNHAIGQDIYTSTVPTTPTTALARNATYTSFGTPTGTNTFEPRLGYRGELALDNQLYLRARNYQPHLARFNATDPAPGTRGTTTLTNEYHYVTNNPLQRTDPLGLFEINDTNAGGTGITGIAKSRPESSSGGTLGTLVSYGSILPGAGLLLAPGVSTATGTVTVTGTVTTTVTLGRGAAAAGCIFWCLAAGAAVVGAGIGCLIACDEYFEMREFRAEANARLDYVQNVVQQNVNNGDTPPGIYGGDEYVDQTPNDPPVAEPRPATDGSGSRKGGPPGDCATNTVNPRDVHGELADTDVDVGHVKAEGDLYIQDDGQLVRVLDNGNGTSDVVVYDPSNPSCAPTTKIKNMPNRQVQSRVDSGRWS